MDIESESVAVDPVAASAPLSRWLLLLLGALAAFSPLSIDMYLPALPAIVGELNASAAGGQSTLSLFLLGLAGGQFIYGTLSDRFGRRPPLIAGIALYIAATLGCVLAPSMEMLAGMRLLQGLGGCAGVVISRAVVADLFRGREAARALSLLMLIMGVAPVLAPIGGAAVAAQWGWRAVFGVQLALALSFFVAALLFLPESRSQAVADHARSEHPLRSYAALIADRRFAGYVLTAALCNASLLAYVATIPGLLVGHFQVSLANVGWFFGIASFVIIGANQINRRMLLVHEPDTLLRAATLFALAPAALLVLLAASNMLSLWAMMPLAILSAAPFAFIQSNASARGFAIEPLRTGSASALFGAGGYFAGALSGWTVSLLGDGSPLALVAVMLACLCGSAAALFGLAQRRPATPHLVS